VDKDPPQEPVVERADVTAILAGIFDIRAELRRIRALFEEDDGEQGHEEEDS
jgi:hypothetical protein